MTQNVIVSKKTGRSHLVDLDIGKKVYLAYTFWTYSETQDEQVVEEEYEECIVEPYKKQLSPFVPLNMYYDDDTKQYIANVKYH